MRFFEFADADAGLDKFVMILRNFIGRAASKKSAARLNWAALQKIATDVGFEIGADEEAIKATITGNSAIQIYVRDFDADGVNLDVPGTDLDTKTPWKKGETSQDAVDKIAAGAAASNLNPGLT